MNDSSIGVGLDEALRVSAETARDAKRIAERSEKRMGQVDVDLIGFRDEIRSEIRSFLRDQAAHDSQFAMEEQKRRQEAAAQTQRIESLLERISKQLGTNGSGGGHG